MPIDVTQFVQNLTKNNPAIQKKLQEGLTQADAMFKSLDASNLNASDLLNKANLPADTQNKITDFVKNADVNLEKLTSGATAGLEKLNDKAAEKIKSILPGKSDNTTNTNTGIDNAKKEIFKQGASKAILAEPDTPNGTALIKVKSDIPILLQSEVRALMCQIGYMASNWDYEKNNQSTGQLGRYQVSPTILKNYEYMSATTSAFTGKDGINSVDEFLFSYNIQDRIMERFILEQYPTLIKVGAIKENDSKETVAGMIAVAYQFQDAKPSSSSLGTSLSDFDSTSLISEAQSLSSSLTEVTNITNTALAKSTSVMDSTNALTSASSSFATLTENSGISKSLQDAGASILPSINSKDPTAALAKVDVSSIKDSLTKIGESSKPLLEGAGTEASKLTDSLKSKVSSVTTSIKDKLTLSNVKVDISKLKASANSFAAGIIASKVKSWRETGAEKDSQGQSGNLYFNAGQYAIKNLAADVEIIGNNG